MWNSYKPYKITMWDAIFYLIGDNNVDKNRKQNEVRQHSGGQAKVMKHYDRTIAYGITTTFYRRPTPTNDEFKAIIDAEFAPLTNYIKNGDDIIIPVNPILYSEYQAGDENCIFHNLGNGIADLSDERREYIQKKILELGYGQNVDYYQIHQDVDTKSPTESPTSSSTHSPSDTPTRVPTDAAKEIESEREKSSVKKSDDDKKSACSKKYIGIIVAIVIAIICLI